MSYEKKAKELVDKYLNNMEFQLENAKQCALIAVDEILDTLEDSLIKWHVLNTDEIINYWKEVKNVINKL